MMKRLFTPYSLYLLAAASLAAAFTALRTVFLFTDYTADLHHFRTSGIEVFVTYGALAIALLLLVGIFFLPRATALPKLPNGKRRYTALLPALLFFAMAVEKLVLLALLPLSTLPLLFLLLSALFAALSAVPFLSAALSLNLSESLSRLLSAVPALFAIFHAMYLYFDESHYMNDPSAMLLILTHVALALFFLFDAKETFGEKTRLSLFFGALAALLSVAAALPSLIYFTVSKVSLVSSIPSDLLLISLAAFITVRLISRETSLEEKK